ncbi:apolipoprotein N-acyltransferase [Marinobacter psychrophilus]|uniref:apolipoprotein N-acyltransferase n=1 Tax=Marinobacter psychrophilus TaxID=330734 RepID=UPI001B76EA78|nr:apolipoprotein N-acyltransferase [Marinobacter psychrophilus]MBQ0763447.1 apolipoprotein N-acyltransferase [Marinobacter psychrophilus]MBQ0845494.1 apolipoprotein N-acyltransferase [Marinobacter psychrophilus]
MNNTSNQHPASIPSAVTRSLSANRWLGAALLLIAGGLQTLTFAPYYLWWLGPVSILLILLVCVPLASSQLFRAGWLTGLGLFASGASWVYVSISQYGNTSQWIAIVLTALFVAGLALFHGLAFWFWGKLARSSAVRRLLLFPAIWLLGDWLRGWVLTGFPWLYLGTAHTDGPLAGLAPLGGVHLVTLAIITTAVAAYGALWLILQTRHTFAATVVVAGLFPWLIAPALNRTDWTTLAQEPTSVAAMQGNIPQQIKWDPEFLKDQIVAYLGMTEDHWNTDIILWPETAIPIPQDKAGKIIDHINERLGQNSTLITGIPWYGFSERSEGFTYHNSITALGAGEGIYHKQKLVPFGEYVPLEKYLRGLIGFFDLPMSSFTPGPKNQSALNANGLRVMPFICYEVAYPDFLARNALNADLLLTISNDGWFGDSIGPLQHLQLARMRALETGRYMLRGTNNGVTAIINNKGQITERIPQFERAVMTGQIYGASGSTPYMVTSSWPVLTFALILIVFVRERVIPKL